jgi:hypothetical protein
MKSIEITPKNIPEKVIFSFISYILKRYHAMGEMVLWVGIEKSIRCWFWMRVWS